MQTMPMMHTPAALAAIALCCAPGPAQAELAVNGDAIEAHEAILHAARGFLEQRLHDGDARFEIQLGALDARLRLARCDGELAGFLPPGARLTGNTSVGVSCSGAAAWKIYVQARITVYRKVAIAQAYLPAGAALTPDKVRFEERDVTGSANGYATGIEDIRGKVLKQAVQEAAIIPAGVLIKPRLVQRGEEIVMMSKSGAFEVRMTGSALMDGAEGDRIKVRNLKSKRVVEGRVEAAGLVMVSM